METKYCPLCKTEKPVSEFAKKGSRYQSRCKPCHNLYTRDHYRRNIQYYVYKARVRTLSLREENRRNLLAYFSEHPCVDCGSSDYRVLEFDHVSGTKSFNLASAWDNKTWIQILQEIKKCEVRCRNCHIIRTQESLGWWRAEILHLSPNG